MPKPKRHRGRGGFAVQSRETDRAGSARDNQASVPSLPRYWKRGHAADPAIVGWRAPRMLAPVVHHRAMQYSGDRLRGSSHA